MPCATPSGVEKTTLFEAGGGIRAVALALDDAPKLQQFFDANPEYFVIVSGKVAGNTAAQQQLDGDVPAEFSFTKQTAVGFIDQHERLIGMADVVSDLMAPGVWHIGLFMVETKEHSRGLGSSLYKALERWIKDAGACWIRLGVVIGNSVAERFWQKHHYSELSVRHGVLIDGKLNDLRVMVKPLGENQLSDYQALILRDRPGAE